MGHVGAPVNTLVLQEGVAASMDFGTSDGNTC